MIIGAHHSISGGFQNAIVQGKACGSQTIQIFTKAPGVWKCKPIESGSAERFIRIRNQETIGPILVHDGYLINPCSSKQSIRNKSLESLKMEAERCDQLGAEYLVIHPGSSPDLAEEKALELVATAVKGALEATDKVVILLENTAGQGNSLGHRFEHLAHILTQFENQTRLGICFDTCHAFAAGYDLRTKESAQKVFEEFDRLIHPSMLRAFHLNDSKRPLGSRVDRHERIGQGEIGMDFFRWLIQEPCFAHTPGILETPIDKNETYANEISTLKALQLS